jgi:hypothetical protein
MTVRVCCGEARRSTRRAVAVAALLSTRRAVAVAPVTAEQSTAQHSTAQHSTLEKPMRFFVELATHGAGPDVHKP